MMWKGRKVWSEWAWEEILGGGFVFIPHQLWELVFPLPLWTLAFSSICLSRTITPILLTSCEDRIRMYFEKRKALHKHSVLLLNRMFKVCIWAICFYTQYLIKLWDSMFMKEGIPWRFPLSSKEELSVGCN